MSLLIETIKISDGFAENISWHNKRFNNTRWELFGINEQVNLEGLISVPKDFINGIVKCRITYGQRIELIEFEPYVYRDIHSLQLVFDDSIQYNRKYCDRSGIIELFSSKGKGDDILIVKNGFVSDSSYCNLVFSDGKEFFTPSSPLLQGTKRAKYLFEGRIAEREVSAEDIGKYLEIHLINAFMDLGKCVVPTTNVI
jgi:4-amino-4-deoxychorismate lyase